MYSIKKTRCTFTQMALSWYWLCIWHISLFPCHNFRFTVWDKRINPQWNKHVRREQDKSTSQRRCSGPRYSHTAAYHSEALHRPGLPAAVTIVQPGNCCLLNPPCCPPNWRPPPPHFSWVAPCSTSSHLPLPPWSRLTKRRSTLQNVVLWIYLEE